MRILQRKMIMIIMLALVMITVPASPLVEALPSVHDHWSRRAVDALIEQDIMQTDFRAPFNPDETISKGDFHQLLHAAFPDRDIEEPDAAIADTFITRAEAAVDIMHYLHLEDIVPHVAQHATGYVDVPQEHHAHDAIVTSALLDIVPPFIVRYFEPYEKLTQGEAAWIIYRALRLTRQQGEITFVDPQTKRLTIETEDGRIRDFRLADNTVLIRSQKEQALADFTTGDTVVTVADRYGTPYVIATTKTAGNQNITTQVAQALLNVFTVEELQQIVMGNWDVVAQGAERATYERLLEAGLTESEATAFLQQDWQTIQHAAQNRLEEAAVKEWHISPDLIAALVQQDWDAAKEKAQLEVAQYALNYLLSTIDPVA